MGFNRYLKASILDNNIGVLVLFRTFSLLFSQPLGNERQMTIMFTQGSSTIWGHFLFDFKHSHIHTLS